MIQLQKQAATPTPANGRTSINTSRKDHRINEEANLTELRSGVRVRGKKKKKRGSPHNYNNYILICCLATRYKNEIQCQELGFPDRNSACLSRAVMHFSPNCNDVGAVSAATSVIHPLT